MRILLFSLLLAATLSAHAQSTPPLSNPTSEEFCVAVQQIMASTSMVGNNEIFTDMPSYRHSKPMVDPLSIYQVISYSGSMPIMVSCKIKGAAHLRSAFGEDAAGEQHYCPTVARRIKEQAIDQLQREGLTEAASKAANFVIVDNEPFMTGRDYLSDFQLSYVGEDGAIHINSPGLFHDYDSWTTWILPENFEGQSYCHIATVDYLSALAKGEMEPGITMTTADDAPVTPQD